jgi:hypothetical protein
MRSRPLFTVAVLVFSTGFVQGPVCARPQLFLSPELTTRSDAPSSETPDEKPNDTDQPESGKLDPQAKLALVRFVDGEFARAVEPLPAGKKGVTVVVGQHPDTSGLLKQAHFEGLAANKGDTVQITAIQFRAKQIVFEINGGSKGHFHLLQHLAIGAGSDPAPVQTADGRSRGATGCTLTLDYGRDLPNLTPDDVKRDLGDVLDFSNQRSSTANWVETIAPEFRQAIKDHQAVVGMDQDMVIAAIGRPDRKVRQREEDGTDTEDWIYGSPPDKTVFVTFASAKVVRVKEFD